MKDLDNISILKNAKSLGFEEEKSFYWAEVLLDKELSLSLDPDSIAIKTTERETYDYLYNGNLEDTLILGEIRGTEHVYEDLKEDTYKDVLLMFKDGQIRPQKCLPLVFNYKKLQENPNIGIFGNSGSGKTYTLKSLIEELIIKNIPTIVFDPHNEFDFSDYLEGIPNRFKFDFDKNVDFFTAGKDFGLRFTDLSNEDLKRFLENTISLTDPQALAIDEIREQADSFERFKEKVSTLAQAKQKDEKKMNQDDFTPSEKDLLLRYGRNISSSVVLFALNAKLSQYSKKGFFGKDYDKIVNSLKNRKVVVIRGDYNIVTPMMSIILNDLWRKRKDFVDGEIEEEYPPIISILDEAHMYAPKDMNAKAPLKNTLIDISREGRKYGMFLICATQRISELHSTIISQMSTKIILKTSQESDKAIIQKECGLNESENNRLHMLDSGHGYIVSPILKSKTALAFKSRCNYSKPKITVNVFDELKTLKIADTKENFEEFIEDKFPFKVVEMQAILKEYKDFGGQNKTFKDLQNLIESKMKEGSVEKVRIDGAFIFRKVESTNNVEEEEPFE